MFDMFVRMWETFHLDSVYSHFIQSAKISSAFWLQIALKGLMSFRPLCFFVYFSPVKFQGAPLTFHTCFEIGWGVIEELPLVFVLFSVLIPRWGRERYFTIPPPPTSELPSVCLHILSSHRAPLVNKLLFDVTSPTVDDLEWVIITLDIVKMFSKTWTWT